MQFIHNGKPSPALLWLAYADEHASVKALVRRYGMSEKWIRYQLDAYVLPEHIPQPRQMVAIGDATKIGATWMLVIRDPNAHENVYRKEMLSETTSAYQMAKWELECGGFVLTAFVGDGRIAVPWLFADLPVQMCHFHQLQIIIRYTTLNPILPAGVELLALAKTLAHTDKETFTRHFNEWQEVWNEFLKERTRDPSTKRWHYTHKRLRGARESLRSHLPYLFTFEDYPELHIPNTTNSLDGSFSKVKTAIAAHAGLTHKRKLKLVLSLLQKRA